MYGSWPSADSRAALPITHGSVSGLTRSTSPLTRALASPAAAESQPSCAARIAARQALNEPFSSLDLAGLKDVDGLGQLPGAPGAAAEFTQDAPGLELGVGAFPGRP